jgi:hypothetical protein
MVMVLPFALAFAAAACAWLGRPRAALALGLLTVGVQVAWLVFHATDRLAIAL